MVKLEIYCVMCGKEKTLELPLNMGEAGTTLKPNVEKAGWIVQTNGENFDIYCSKRCAE